MEIAASNGAKLRGGYYTPDSVARWLVSWAIRSDTDRLLEPSCGDGAFIRAIIGEFQERATLWKSSESSQVVGVELSEAEAKRARSAVVKAGYTGCIEVVPDDFFEWANSARPATFDAILGNPPFIRYQNFPEPSRSQAMAMMEAQGLKPNRLTNIWVPFVVASVTMLRPGGRLAMVLPAELLQVSYAAQIRQHLADSFKHLTIVACNEIFFENAEQEVVLLLADDKLEAPSAENRCDIALSAYETVKAMLAGKPKTTRRQSEIKYVQHSTEKWLKFFLNRAEIDFMRALRTNKNVSMLSQHAEVDVGVVTGKNGFFVLSRDQVETLRAADYVVPLVGRSSQLAGAVIRKTELKQLAESGSRVYLLHLTGHRASDLPNGLQRFIEFAEKEGVHRGYKCSIRDPWYHVPSVWQPDCFLFRQIYDFPRAVVNKAEATSTDTIHRMECKGGPVSRVAANLYTHLTAASAEIEGRSYGGGVLELEPTEAERLLVPKSLNGAMPIEEADALIRQGRLQDVLDENDKHVLRDSVGLSASECATLKAIWTKMRDRRRMRRRN